MRYYVEAMLVRQEAPEYRHRDAALPDSTELERAIKGMDPADSLDPDSIVLLNAIADSCELLDDGIAAPTLFEPVGQIATIEEQLERAGFLHAEEVVIMRRKDFDDICQRSVFASTNRRILDEWAAI